MKLSWQKKCVIALVLMLSVVPSYLCALQALNRSSSSVESKIDGFKVGQAGVHKLSILDILEHAKQSPVEYIVGLDMVNAQLLKAAYDQYMNMLNSEISPVYALQRYAAVIDLIISRIKASEGGIVSFVVAPFTNTYNGFVNRDLTVAVKGVAGLTAYACCGLFVYGVSRVVKLVRFENERFWHEERQRQEEFNRQRGGFGGGAYSRGGAGAGFNGGAGPRPHAGGADVQPPVRWEQSHYAALGIARRPQANLVAATEIRKAYLRLSMQHHPDKGGDAERFKSINEANQVLSDPGTRAVYDRTVI